MKNHDKRIKIKVIIETNKNNGGNYLNLCLLLTDYLNPYYTGVWTGMDILVKQVTTITSSFWNNRSKNLNF